jgi:single-stranded-DNA-specific exonuclease
MRWEILSKRKVKSKEEIVKELLKNRGIKDTKNFFNPPRPEKIKLISLGVSKIQLKKALTRIREAKKNKEKVVVYGDYDADGICATAIMWEALYKFGLDVLPHIPDRFSEGYGINAESVEKIRSKTPELKLIITVDNGIVAYEGIKKAKDLGIDVVVIDHHSLGKKKNTAFSVIHSTKVCGSALVYFFVKEVGDGGGLDLAAIGTIADQLPLLDENRSIVRYGLEAVNDTKRPGLLALFTESGIQKVGTYEVNYIIAPRINAMGRLAQGIDSLRLLCTTDKNKARILASELSQTNIRRQKIVEEVVIHTRENVSNQKVIVLANESYHEGVIGLAAGKLVEEFYRPAIVLSKKGDISKASARSISGFNIIENIRKLEGLIIEGGGHPMAAGFSIMTSKIEEFTKKINKLADEVLTAEILERKLKIDIELTFNQINWDLLKLISDFNPTGLGNPTPTFSSKSVEVIEIGVVGQGGKHLKLKLKQNEQIFDAIYFGGGEFYSELLSAAKMDVSYQIQDNSWNGSMALQLKVRDVHLLD